MVNLISGIELKTGKLRVPFAVKNSVSSNLTMRMFVHLLARKIPYCGQQQRENACKLRQGKVYFAGYILSIFLNFPFAVMLRSDELVENLL